MDHNIAKQILESHGVIEVFYHGEPVWIEQVKVNNTADICFLKTNERLEVPVDDLIHDQNQRL